MNILNLLDELALKIVCYVWKAECNSFHAWLTQGVKNTATFAYEIFQFTADDGE